MTARGPANRRDFLIGGAGVAAGAGLVGAGLALHRSVAGEPTARSSDSDAAGQGLLVAANGPTQAGIERPATPQGHALITVWDLPSRPDLTFLPRLGQRILEFTDPRRTHQGLPDGPGSLTVTVGLGPRIIRSIDPKLPGAEELPDFHGDQRIATDARGGDLLIALHGDHPNDLAWVAGELAAEIPGVDHRWTQAGFRNPGEGTVTRNPLGFFDGVIVPRKAEEMRENVWLDGSLAGGTVCVIRRLRLDTVRFRSKPVDRQQEIIGRKLDGGEPLSGGGLMSQVDLRAKTPEGEFVTPVHSHVRAAHPSFTGSHLMLRRGYGFDNGVDEHDVADNGLMFICFQKDLRTFVATQQRLDEVDDLMGFVTATASATFLILPGFDASRPLGSSLRAVQNR
jgi:dye decolorizing peroxidase